jgi:hypothetical protein
MNNPEITRHVSSRLGNEYWVITWGPGETQRSIALSYEEALAVASGSTKPVEPLVSFRGS